MRTKTRIHGPGKVYYQAALPMDQSELVSLLQRRFGARMSVARAKDYCCAALPGRFRMTADPKGVLLILDSQASQATWELDILALGDAMESLLPRALKRVA